MPWCLVPAGARMVAFQSKAVLAPMKIKTTRIIPKELTVLFFRVTYYDGFVIGRRCDGVVVVVDKALKVATPTITVGDSTTTVAASGAEIYYTTDGSDPRYSRNQKEIFRSFSQTQKLLKLLLMQTANSFPMLLKNNGRRKRPLFSLRKVVNKGRKKIDPLMVINLPTEKIYWRTAIRRTVSSTAGTER